MTDRQSVADLYVSLHDHFSRILEAHERLQDEQFASLDKALVLAREESQRQFHLLNNLRTEYTEDRNQYLLTSVHEVQNAVVDTRLRSIDRKVDELSGLFKVWGSVILALSLAAQLIGHFIWK